MTYKMPDLPDNQRWYVYTSMGTFLHVKLQEKRKWFGWQTIASGIEYVSLGTVALQRCIEQIVNRDYYARLQRERRERNQADYNRIPFGPSK